MGNSHLFQICLSRTPNSQDQALDVESKVGKKHMKQGATPRKAGFKKGPVVKTQQSRRIAPKDTVLHVTRSTAPACRRPPRSCRVLTWPAGGVLIPSAGAFALPPFAKVQKIKKPVVIDSLQNQQGKIKRILSQMEVWSCPGWS